MMDMLRIDVVHTWRSLTARLGSTLGIIAVLAVGVGAATALFAISDPFFLKPLPYRDPGRLIIIQVDRLGDSDAVESPVKPAPTLDDWRAHTHLFETVGAYGGFERIRAKGNGGSYALRVRRVSRELPTILGGRGVAGVAIFGNDETAAVVKSAATQQIVTGSTLVTDNGLTLIVGANVPELFLFPVASVAYRPDVILPARFSSIAWTESGGSRYLTAIARLKPGVTPDQAAQSLSGPAMESGLALRVESLDSYMNAGLQPLAIGALVLGILIAIVSITNVMNLLVGRGLFRAREFVIRRSVGATNAGLMRLVLIELMAYGLAANLLGLVLAYGILSLIGQLIPMSYVGLGLPELTARPVAFSGALTVMVVLLCGFPAWLSIRGTKVNLRDGMALADGRRLRLWRFALTSGQTAVAMVLLVSALFVGRSYINLWGQEAGFRGESRLISVSYPRNYNPEMIAETTTSTMRALRAVSGVQDVGAGMSIGLLIDGYMGAGGAVVRAGGTVGRVVPARVTPNFFDVLGVRLLAGRVLNDTDRGWDHIVVNRAAVRRLWPDRAPEAVIGEAINGDGQPGEVVGVVEDLLDRSLDQPSVPRLYQRLELTPLTRMSYAVRLTRANTQMDAQLRRAVLAVDNDAIVESLDSPEGRLAESIRDRSFSTLLFVMFSSAALAVTGTGILAAVSFVVARRTREIAIRIALGARRGDVIRLVVIDAAAAAGFGAAVGMAVSSSLSRALESQLFGVAPGDPLTPIIAAVGLVALTALASWPPIRRALSLPPTLALRAE